MMDLIATGWIAEDFEWNKIDSGSWRSGGQDAPTQNDSDLLN